ncbi:helix-turn-helix domain-containing protein [Achromobacter xylosoxidans]
MSRNPFPSPAAPPQFSAQFDSRVTPDAPDIWRTLVRPYVDTQIETGIQPFTAQMSGTHLGDSLISRSTCSATVQHRRTALDVRRSQVDHLLIQLFVAGGTRGDYGKNPVDIRAGSIGLLDLGQTLDTRTTLISTITLTVPRDRLPTALRSRKLHGTLLDPGQGATRMLASHLSQLAQHASSLTREEMSASVNAGLILLSGSLSTLRDGEDDGPARQVVRNGMRRLVREHIERHLDAGHLSPETIAAALGISRSSLYRLFLRDGGVNAYIQGRRLDRCFDELLLAAGGHIGIAELAYRYGFSSESAFSRAFRLRFGASPSEVRAHARGNGDGESVDIRSREDAAMIQAWLADIRQPTAAAG